MNLLILILIVLVVLALALYVVTLLPIPDGRISQLIKAILVIVAIIFIAEKAGWLK